MTPAERYDSLLQVYAGFDRVYGSTNWTPRPEPLDWQMLRRQAITESSLNPRAINPKSGAKGLFQFMDPTWREWTDRKAPLATLDVFNPEHNIWLATCYMDWLGGLFQRDIRKALAAFNWGPGNVRKAVLAHGDGWAADLPIETFNYVGKIAKWT